MSAEPTHPARSKPPSARLPSRSRVRRCALSSPARSLPTCEIDPGMLAERCAAGLAELAVVDRTHPAYDLAAIAREHSVRGRFVARLLGSDDPAASEAAVAGLRAMDGHTELVA